uniref:Uncharacterized protein n=1 Tax=Timema monikensis TaxID=170555 RepID=A0A7R9E9T8_9NEOP|nr:unnamed protein product [Timema monikensis]
MEMLSNLNALAGKISPQSGVVPTTDNNANRVHHPHHHPYSKPAPPPASPNNINNNNNMLYQDSKHTNGDTSPNNLTTLTKGVTSWGGKIHVLPLPETPWGHVTSPPGIVDRVCSGSFVSYCRALHTGQSVLGHGISTPPF